MLWYNKIFLVLKLSTLCLVGVCAADEFDIKNLIPGRIYHSTPRNGYEKLSIYCYKGVPKNLVHFCQTVKLHLNVEPKDIKTYLGHTSEEVLEEYVHDRNSWTPTLFSWRSNVISLNPFNSTCVGVHTSVDHTAFIHILRVDFWRVISLVVGILLFLSSQKLSTNSFFYYVCGISLGLTMSFAVLVYFISKFIPKKTVLAGYVVGGTVGAYVLSLLWQHFRLVLTLYQNYVFGYVSVVSLISFAVCYRIGPVSNPRTIKLIQWALQGGGLGLIFFSSQYQEASFGVVLFLVIYYNFAQVIVRAVKIIWRKRFPPRVKLLSESEYHEQGARETMSALEELRQYCSSPECNQWKTVLKLKRPIRFAEFMEGESHLSDDEILLYEEHNSKPPLETSDESDASEED